MPYRKKRYSRFKRRSFRRPRTKGYRKTFRKRRFRRSFKRRSRRGGRIDYYWARIVNNYLVGPHAGDPYKQQAFAISLSQFDAVRSGISTMYQQYNIVKSVVRWRTAGTRNTDHGLGPLPAGWVAGARTMLKPIEPLNIISVLDRDGSNPTTIAGYREQPTVREGKFPTGVVYTRSHKPNFYKPAYISVGTYGTMPGYGWVPTVQNTIVYAGPKFMFYSNPVEGVDTDDWRNIKIYYEQWLKVAFKGKNFNGPRRWFNPMV